MKRTYYLYLSIYLLNLCLVGNAYSQISNDIFEKKWKLILDVQQKIAKMPAEERKAYDKLTPDQKKRIEADLVLEIEKSTISFNTNNSFYVEFEGTRSYEGSWRISDDGRSVVLETKEGIQERIVIKKIEAEKVIIANAEKQDAPDILLVPIHK